MPESKSGALPLGDAPNGVVIAAKPLGFNARPPARTGVEQGGFAPVAGAGSHGYKGRPRGGPGPHDMASESSSAW
jgi:hypothetical protein